MNNKRVIVRLLILSTLFSVCAGSAFGQVMMSIPVPQDVDQASLVFDAGVKLLNKHKYAEAAAKFKEVTRLKPTYVEAYFNEATALLYTDRFDEAISLLDKALELRPNFAKAYFQKAACLERLARYLDAKAAYESYLELQPQASNAQSVRDRIAALSTEANRAPVRVSSEAPDYLEETVQNGLTRWPSDRMPLKTFIADGSKVPHYSPEYADIVRQAFGDWCSGLEGKVACKFIDDPSAADIQVTWTNDPKELVTPLEGGHALVSFNSDKILNARIILLTVAADGKVVSQDTLKQTALHEIGHALGLAGHSSSKDDVMCAVFDREHPISELSKRDRNTLTALYNANDEFIAKHPTKLAELASSDERKSPVVLATKLNAEGVAALKNNDFDLAAAKFTEALKVKPNFALVEKNLTVLYAQKSMAEYNAGVALLRSQQFAEAAAKFAEAARVKPDFMEAYFNQAIALMNLEKFQEAIPLLDKVLELHPNNEKAVLQKAACLQRMGDFSEAIAAMETYLKLKPDAADAETVRNSIAVMKTEAGRSHVKGAADAPDYLEETIQNGLTRWTADHMPVKVYIADGSNVPHYLPEYADLVRKCFSEWCDGLKGKFDYQYTKDPSIADIQVSWTNDPKELMTPLEGGHTLLGFNGSKIASAKIALLTTMVDGRVLSEDMLHHVALHEIGHALGLTGHSSGSDDVMFAMGAKSSSLLTKRDLNTVAALYAADDALVAKHPLNIMPMTENANLNSPLIKATRLNAEGVAALNGNDLQLAKSKFTEALQLKPGDPTLGNNLGVVYAREADLALKQGKHKESVALAKSAIEYWEQGHNVNGLKQMLPTYANVLDYIGDKAGAKKARTRLAELQ